MAAFSHLLGRQFNLIAHFLLIFSLFIAKTWRIWENIAVWTLKCVILPVSQLFKIDEITLWEL